jgi:single-stranded-DNA-specific exonuclease
VDCGSTSVEVVLALKQRNVDVLVLDHHQVSNPQPPVVALVNPQLGGQFRELCSAGLAFKLLHALLKRMRDLGIPEAASLDLRPSLDLVALGTIADMVPLTGENRILATAGLAQLNDTRRLGLLALKSVASAAPVLDSYDVAFQLAPRLNAAGRLEDACDALKLLLTKDAPNAQSLAAQLDHSNRQRQEIERAMSNAIIAMVRPDFDAARDFVIVHGSADWHIGVVGIVASRIVQQFHRPTIIFGGDGSSWRGSGRSIDGFDLAAALRSCSDLLLRHGGHAMAAGASIEPANVDSFRLRFNDLARAALTPEQLRPRLDLDAEVDPSTMTLSQVEELDGLDPVGQGNPPVRLAMRALRHARPPQRMGRENQHAKLRVIGAGGGIIEAVWWNCRETPMPSDPFDLAFTPKVNTYNERRSVQLKVLDWRPSVPTPFPPPQ